MKRLLVPILLGSLAAAFPAHAPANALTVMAPEAPRPAETLPKAAITKLEVQPAKIEIGSKYGYTQILVTAHLADGTSADVTRLADLSAPEGLVTVTPQGQVNPLKDGEGALKVEVVGQTASIPISVSGYAKTPSPDFIRDVNPVMTKLGCNAGTCHGAKEGKYGFKLSLRGYDPVFDVRALKDDLACRRLNVASPDDSLMLLKATAGVPHEGGQRTKIGEKYYEILRTWIADGARLNKEAARVARIDVIPKNPVVQDVGALQQTRILATYADGTSRDVTAEAFVSSGNTDVAVSEEGGLIRTLRRGEAPILARYEGNYAATTVTVMGNRDGFQWSEAPAWNRVDELVSAKWKRMKILPSELSTDVEFLRRIYLDLTGLPPSSDDVRAFTADTREPQVKRNELIEKLIGSPDFVDYWTNKWCDMLEVNSKFLAPEGASAFRLWIRSQVEANVPYDVFVRTLIQAKGSTKDNPAANYWKTLREPQELMENTSQLFLATRFNCNKCHDHPFERWTQDQYYHFGAFFAQVQRARDPQSGSKEIKGNAVDKTVPLWEIISDAKTGDMIHLRTGKPAAPTFPFVAKVNLPENPAPTRREQLAAWLTSSDNRFFALSYVNRIWGYLTGVGVIEPLDDIRAGNPPTNPELLDYLTKEFIDHKFDIRHVMRLICQSRTYQLSLTTNKWNEDDKINYSHATARRLPAEVLYDSVLKVTGSQSRLPGVAGTRAGQLPDSAIDLPSGFLAALGRPARETACECERSSDIRLGSVMSLLSGPAVAEAVGDPKGGIGKLVAAQPDDHKLVEEIFLRVLNRPVKEVEATRTLESWSKIAAQNVEINKEWEAKETEQAPIIDRMEKERLAAVDVAKTELARYEKEIAPKVAEAEKKRVALVAANQAALKAYEAKPLAAAQAQWEETLPVERTYTGWQPLGADIKRVSASGAAKPELQKDGSIFNHAGKVLGTTDYAITIDSKVAGITGILLEVIPDASLPSNGPGTGSGNFVLTELTCEWAPKGSATLTETKFKSAVADFAQDKFPASAAIDGNKEAGNNGWAIAPQTGRRHLAAFALSQPIGSEAGATISLKMYQRMAGLHLGQFRLWYTTDKHVSLGLPADVLAAMKIAPEARTKQQSVAVAAYFKQTDLEEEKKQLALAQSQQPLPTDPGVVERRGALAKAEEPIRLDPKLVQLRQDHVQSKLQADNQRLTGAQDLVWALINNPAFLFNH